MDNVTRLREAGVLSDDDEHLYDEHVDAINALSDEEVDCLISVHEKVGLIEVEGHEPGKAWFV